MRVWSVSVSGESLLHSMHVWRSRIDRQVFHALVVAARRGQSGPAVFTATARQATRLLEMSFNASQWEHISAPSPGDGAAEPKRPRGIAGVRRGSRRQFPCDRSCARLPRRAGRAPRGRRPCLCAKLKSTLESARQCCHPDAQKRDRPLFTIPERSTDVFDASSARSFTSTWGARLLRPP